MKLSLRKHRGQWVAEISLDARESLAPDAELAAARLVQRHAVPVLLTEASARSTFEILDSRASPTLFTE